MPLLNCKAATGARETSGSAEPPRGLRRGSTGRPPTLHSASVADGPDGGRWSNPGGLRYLRGVDATDVRRWIAGFEAIAEADREALRRKGADPAWAIGLALSMIEAAERAGHGPGSDDPSRAVDEEALRATWVRLHQRAGR